jgi:DNA polymerase III subunit delta
VSAPNLGYFFGDDAYGLDRAADSMFERLAAEAPGLDRWRIDGDATTAGRIAERVATGSLFGGGTLVIVVDPTPLLKSRDDRDALEAVIAQVAPGNGLAFVEPTDGSNRRLAALVALQKKIAEAGGEARELKAPKEGQLTAWIEGRARERGIPLAPSAAREIATRIGGFVHEGDIDRLRQGQLAVSELEKLALYRDGAPVTVDDVKALVAETVPGSSWAFLDAIGLRRAGRALELLDPLLESTHELVVMVTLHRRIRELVEVADHLASGATPGSLVRAMRLKPFRAERLVEQARAWSQDELDEALESLVELDATLRGAPGTPNGDAQKRLAFVLWISEKVGRASPAGAR